METQNEDRPCDILNVFVLLALRHEKWSVNGSPSSTHLLVPLMKD